MRKSKIIKWNEKEVVVKELTVEEIATLMETEPVPAALDMVFSDRVPVVAVEMSTGLECDDLKSFPPSQLDPLWSAVEEVNPFFVRMLDQLAEKGRILIEYP